MPFVCIMFYGSCDYVMLIKQSLLQVVKFDLIYLFCINEENSRVQFTDNSQMTNYSTMYIIVVYNSMRSI